MTQLSQVERAVLKDVAIEAFFEAILEHDDPDPLEVFAMASVLAKMFFRKPRKKPPRHRSGNA